MTAIRRWAAGAAALAAAVLGGTAAADHPDHEYPDCSDPKVAPAFELVAPKTVPWGYKSGFYIEEQPSAANRGSRISTTPFGPVTVEPAKPGGRLAHRYEDPNWRKLDYYDRWPLRIARGDGDARIRVRYIESQHDSRTICRRTLERIVRAERVPKPRMHVSRRTTATNDSGWRVRTRVRGRMRRTGRPVVLVLYEGLRIWDFERVTPRGGRFAATLGFDNNCGCALGPIKVVVQWPGDVKETWPCDSWRSSGVTDGCRKRLRRPPLPYDERPPR